MPCCNQIIRASQTLTPCECKPESFPFVCQKHGGCEKHEHWYNLCRSRNDYFQHWEEKGRGGPCINSEIHLPTFGLGDAVAWLLLKVGINPWPGCGCQGRKAMLNRVRLWPLWRHDARE